jgi:hypothetical protein
MAGPLSPAVRVSQTLAVSTPSAGRPREAWKAWIAIFRFVPSRPSMTPGEKRARSSSTCARIRARVLASGSVAAGSKTWPSIAWAAAETEGWAGGAGTTGTGAGGAAACGLGVAPAGAWGGPSSQAPSVRPMEIGRAHV